MTTLTVTSGAPDQAVGKQDKHERAEERAKVAKSRVQCDFAPRSMERLNNLKAKTEATSYAEVIKNALQLYEALIEETEAGKQFLVRDKDGQISPYRLFL